MATAQKPSAQTENIFHLFFEQSADAILLLENGIFIECNQAAIQMMRAANKEQFLAVHPSRLSPEHQPDGRLSTEKADEMIRIALEKGSNRFEWVHRRLDGEDFPVEVLLTRITIGDRQVIQTVWRDISDRKQAETEIRYLATFVEAASEAIMNVTMQGKIAAWNAAAEHLFGYTKEEIIGRSIISLSPPELQEQASGFMQKLARGESIPPTESVRLTKDGRRINVLISASPIKNDAGQVISFNGVMLDISEQKQAEQALKDSEERFRRFSDVTSEGLVFHEQGKIVDANEALVKIFGYSNASELIGKNLLDFIAPEARPTVIKQIQSGNPLPYEAVALHKDGTPFPVEAAARQYEFEGKTIRVASIRDITERKKAEIELLRLKNAVEQTGDGIAITDIDGNLLYANPAWAEMHGYTLEEIIGKHLSMFHTPEQLERDVAPFNEKAMATGHSSGEIGHVRKDGTVFPTLMTVTLRRDANGQPIGLIGTARDISDQIKTREILQESETRFRTMADFTYDWEYWLGPDGKFIYVSPSCERISGYSVDDFMNEPNLFTHLVSPEDQAAWEEHMRTYHTAHGLESGEIDMRIINRNGETRWFNHVCRAVHDQQGHWLGRRASNRDITDRMILQQEIQESLERRGRQVQITTQIAQSISSATDLGDLYQRVVIQVKEQFGYYHAQILRYDPVQNAVVLVTGYGEVGAKMMEFGHTLPMGTGLIGTAASTGQTVLRPALRNDPDWRPNPLLPDTKGEIAIPIKLGETILGVLDVQSDTADALSSDDQLLLEGLCGQIAVTIESTRLRQEMNERLEEINRLYQAMRHEGWKAYQQTEKTAAGFMFDQMGVIPVSNENLAQEFFANLPIAIPGGEVVGNLAVADDPQRPLTPEERDLLGQITEQIALALESARLFDQTQLALAQSEKLFEASRSLTQATDLQELVHATINTLNIPSINRAILTIFHYDSTGSVESLDIIANWWNGQGHEVTKIGTHYPLEVIRVMPMFVSQTPVFFNDTYTDERVDKVTLELVQRLNLRSVGVLPLHVGSQQIGALVLEGEEPHSFTQDETRLFTALAPQISTVLENRRQYERAQKQAERESMLNTISQKIQSATTVEAVLQIAARELGHALGAPLTIAQLGMKDNNN